MQKVGARGTRIANRTPFQTSDRELEQPWDRGGLCAQVRPSLGPALIQLTDPSVCISFQL